jgi:hypothetical protein
MQHRKQPPLRNRLDLADRTQVRLMRRRLGISGTELSAIVDRIGNSIAAISKEALRRSATPKTSDAVPPAAIIDAVKTAGPEMLAEATVSS